MSATGGANLVSPDCVAVVVRTWGSHYQGSDHLGVPSRRGVQLSDINKSSLVYLLQICLLGLAVGLTSSIKERATSDRILLWDALRFASFPRQEGRISYYSRAGGAWSHR